ncbi:MAG: hypothetical protein IJY50_09750 [Clostridia bacterium]|nr:hypothetical protein [Clostridia bacterium]
MGDIVKQIGDGFTGIIEPMTQGIKTAFSHLIYADPAAAEPVLSDIAKVGLTVGGIGLAIGLVMGIFAFIKHLRG